jgi:hypothetical protein
LTSERWYRRVKTRAPIPRPRNGASNLERAQDGEEGPPKKTDDGSLFGELFAVLDSEMFFTFLPAKLFDALTNNKGNELSDSAPSYEMDRDGA